MRGLVTAVQGKGYYVNALDSEMLKEQHLRNMVWLEVGGIRRRMEGGFYDG